MADSPSDAVVTYVTNGKGESSEEYDRLQKLIEEGYRVIDVISIMSGGAAGLGFTTTTVILANANVESRYCKAD